MNRKIPYLLIGGLFILLLIGAVSADGNDTVIMNPVYGSGADHSLYLDVPPGGATYNSAPDNVIEQIWFPIYSPESVTVLLHKNSGATTTASVDYSTPSWGNEALTITIGGESYTFNSIGFGAMKRIGISYAVNNATGNPQYFISIAQTANLNPFAQPTGYYQPILYEALSGRPSDDPIIQVDFITTSGLMGNDANGAVLIYYCPLEILQTAENAEETGNAGVIDWVKNTLFAIWDMVMLIWGIFSFFFIENLLLLIFLIEGTILAYRFNTSSNIFIALSRTATDNERLFFALITLVRYIIALVWDAVNLLNPMRWILGK